MGLWEIAGHIAFASLIFAFMLDTKWRRKLLKRHGEKV